MLHQLVALAETNRWRLVLVGDHRQLQAVGRGGLFAELCANGRVDELERLHRFRHEWEAAASLLLRSGDPRAFDAYQAHDRIIPGTFEDHLERIATTWIEHHERGETIAVVASTNEHVDAINRAIQAARVNAGRLEPGRAAAIAGGDHVYVGDVVATRRNDRTLITPAGEPVRNRETWTVAAIGTDSSLRVTREQGHGTVELPVDYVREYVRLGYAATEHGYQSDTVDHAIALTSTTTTRRGVYVAATRGRDSNVLRVVTDSNDVAEARDVLDGILAIDRADIPAVTQRRTLAAERAAIARDHRPTKARRCQLPAWFEPLRADLHRDLDAAERTASAASAQQTRLVDAVAAVERELTRVEMATARSREALAASTMRRYHAQNRYDDAQRVLATSGLRGRRRARRDLELAERELAQAAENLADVRRRAAPDVKRHDHAQQRVTEARTAVHQHDVRTRLAATRRRVTNLRSRAECLDLWRRWADGDAIGNNEVERLIHQLTAIGRSRDDGEQYCALGEAVRDWAIRAGIELRGPGRLARRLERSGPEVCL